MASSVSLGEAKHGAQTSSPHSDGAPLPSAFFDLPSSSNEGRAGRSNRGLGDYIRKMKNWTQMDWELTMWQMAYLCFQPSKVYDATKVHKQTKNQWARDDPGFVVLLVLLLVMAVIAWCAAFRSLHSIPKMVLYVVVVDFLLLSLVAATINWFVTNRMVVDQGSGGPGNAQSRSSLLSGAGASSFLVNQRVEWLYAFDVHCNSFFPAFLVLHVLQFILLPFILHTPSFISTLISNSVFLLAFGYYHIITALGFSALPFIGHRQVLMFPIQILVLLFVVSLIFQFNVSKWFLTFYFPLTHP